MATEDRWASSHITGGCSTPTNANGASDATWTTDTGNTNWTSRWAMSDPSAAITGTQTIEVLARKDSAGGGNPNVDTVNLYENGSLVSTLVGSTSITSATSQTLQGTFDASAITNRNDVEIEVATSGAGGKPADRRAVQLDSIKWIVNLDAGSATGNLSVTLGAATLSAAGVAPIQGQATPTLGALTAVGSGTQLNEGDLGVTLGAATTTATAQAEVQGTFSSTLGEVALAATAAHSTEGTLGVSFDAATGVASGQAEIQGTATPTLDAGTLSSAAAVDVQGVFSESLDEATAVGTGQSEVGGATSVSLGAATLVSYASLEVDANLSTTLDNATATATGVVPANADLGSTLEVLSLSADGSLAAGFGQLNVTLDELTEVGAGIVEVRGDFVRTLANATLASSGAVDVTGAGAATLGVATLVGIGVVGGGPPPGGTFKDRMSRLFLGEALKA